ncbi:phage holin family protein [Telluribacter sp.]|jgi:F0F1-type ATP synthase assembly protein I|uniref:phage holin family protein n=1 Tax=Telluribacter sp. TaxID=1978767 RepID=UPI002E12D436|nr:phage holin family protein [Telluribacter sp.]
MLLQDAKSKAEETFGHLIEYAEARWNVIALQISEKSANAASAVITGLSLAVIGLISLLFVSIALAVWLGDLLNSLPLGFVIVAIIYAIVGGVLFSNRKKWIFIPIMNSILESLYREKDDNDKNSR